MEWVTFRNSRAIYAGLKKSLQQEWYFVQRSTQGLGDDFRTTKKALWEEFLPTLFLGVETTIPGLAITGFQFKQSGLTVLGPTLTVQGSWMAPCVAIGHIVTALYG